MYSVGDFTPHPFIRMSRTVFPHHVVVIESHPLSVNIIQELPLTGKLSSYLDTTLTVMFE